MGEGGFQQRNYVGQLGLLGDRQGGFAVLVFGPKVRAVLDQRFYNLGFYDDAARGYDQRRIAFIVSRVDVCALFRARVSQCR